MFFRPLFVLFPFFFSPNCVVCFSICRFWLPLWYLQTLLTEVILNDSALCSANLDDGIEYGRTKNKTKSYSNTIRLNFQTYILGQEEISGLFCMCDTISLTQWYIYNLCQRSIYTLVFAYYIIGWWHLELMTFTPFSCLFFDNVINYVLWVKSAEKWWMLYPCGVINGI